MARLRAEIKRGFLRSLWRVAKPATKTVNDFLGDFQASCFQWVQSGRIIASTSGGGYSSSFAEASAALELTPTEVFALSEEFFTIYTFVMSSNPPADPAATGDDAEPIINAMLDDDRMQTVRYVHPDNAGLRFPYGASSLS